MHARNEMAVAVERDLDARVAKSLLDDHQIACSLADENSNLYAGTGQFAIPIRLLLAKEQVEQALHILDDARQPLPDDFDPDKGSSDRTEDIGSRIRVDTGNTRQIASPSNTRIEAH